MQLPGVLSLLPVAAALIAQPMEGPPPPGVVAGAEPSAEISVLTYNIRGLPWPVALGRPRALKAIGQELARMRVEGRQPTVVLIQEGFRREAAELVKASGYRYWAQGPLRGERTGGGVAAGGFRRVRYPVLGEGWGKLTGAGLYVLSDLPITDVKRAAYRYCAGIDCLANKGVMLVRLKLPTLPVEVDVVNTHMNSKGASRTPRARSSKAHNLQTDELMSFVAENRSSGPLLMGGDFNVKGAPERYYYKASRRSYTVVAEFCAKRESGCQGRTTTAEPWLATQDLQAFESSRAVEVRPEVVAAAFDGGPDGARLSDHDGYLVHYRLSWDAARMAEAGQPRDLASAAP